MGRDSGVRPEGKDGRNERGREGKETDRRGERKGGYRRGEGKGNLAPTVISKSRRLRLIYEGRSKSSVTRQ